MTVRLGVITQVYDPETGSAAVPGAISRALAGHGHEVHVLTGFPNYPTGKIYPDYRMRPYQYEFRSGVHVHRIPLVPSHDRSAARRAMTYLSFGASAALRWRILRSVDAWLVYSTPATVAMPALVANTLFGRPYVLLIQDLWPDTVVNSGFMHDGRFLNAAVRGLHAFCDTAYRRASSVMVTAPGMADVICQRGVPADKLSLVPNWVDESVFRPVPRNTELARKLGIDGFVVMYAGSLGDLQGLDTAIEAVQLLTDLTDVRLVFVGSGVAEDRLRAAADGMSNVHFLGQQPVAQMAELMALSDVQLVSLQDLPMFRATLPSKVQAALATGRPIVGAVAGDAARIISESGAGVVVPPGDPHELAAAVRGLHSLGATARESMGCAGRRFYEDTLSARVGSTALADALERASMNGKGGKRR
ncbi:glycosyltransferase family 4 protein [Phytoactinopolyspora halotolerans]|uniref:Glycosyltransferase family 4 protein n=1 Tax=Phytoactinopolyspora halotolerans TaxID=1981512 RepID=A0A6L9S882_9ACTN|nr:glycosyltransferase family 4 protein [Phytoactinopolyspora halotolerans]NEE00190.1 glycosyltransferase family 4 protein [Phytoactinopolyspora halotolerans]